MKPTQTSRRSEPALRPGDREPAVPGALAEPGRAKLAYRPPRLVCYGRLAEVTQFGGSQLVDSGNNLGNLPG